MMTGPFQRMLMSWLQWRYWYKPTLLAVRPSWRIPKFITFRDKLKKRSICTCISVLEHFGIGSLLFFVLLRDSFVLYRPASFYAQVFWDVPKSISFWDEFRDKIPKPVLFRNALGITNYFHPVPELLSKQFRKCNPDLCLLLLSGDSSLSILLIAISPQPNMK